MQVFKKDYHGFESWAEIGRDMSEMFDEPSMKNVPPEGQGTLRITVEYIPSEEDEEQE